MRYKLQKSYDDKTWEDAGKVFNSKREVDEYIDSVTPSGILDWRAGWNFKLRPDRDGDGKDFYQVVKEK
jgi:hypothetical protein